MKKGLAIWVGVTLAWATPCDSCGVDFLCLSDCAYQMLVRASTPEERHEAALLLAHSWLGGDLAEGVPRLVYPIIRGREGTDSLRLHALLLLAQAQYRIGRIDSAVLIYDQVSAQEKYPLLKARAHLGLAAALMKQDLLRALGHAAQAAEIADKIANPLLSAIAYIQLSHFTAEGRNLSTALQYGEHAIKAAQQAYVKKVYHWLLEPAEKVYAAAIANLAALYAENGRFLEAEQLYQEALSHAWQDTLTRGQAVLGLAALYFQKGAHSTAQKFLITYQDLLKRLPYELRREALRLEAQLSLRQNRLSDAITAYEKLIEEAETQIKEGQSGRIEQLRLLSKLEAQEAYLRSMESSRQKERTLYLILTGVGLLAMGALTLAVRSARKRAAEERNFREVIAIQAHRIEEQARVLERQNEELLRISETLTEALTTVQESYAAARRLQRAILPDLERRLPGAAAYYQPMQEVGGDFYAILFDPSSQRLLFFLGDATGHGVSGAILAGIFSSTLQNLFLRDPLQSPRSLLQATLKAVTGILRSEESVDGKDVREGADLIVGIADFQAQKVSFGLAGRPLWLFTTTGTIQIVEGGKRGIDSYTPVDYAFPQHEEPLHRGMTFFLFTDGVSDAINHEGKKWGIRALRQFLEGELTHTHSPTKLRESLIAALREWRGSVPPNDDATFIFLPAEALYAYAEQRLKERT